MNQKDCLALPPGAQAYKRTPVFTQDTVPAGLLRDHVTREGTWALIHVLEGVVRYRVPGLDVEQDLHPAAAPGSCCRRCHTVCSLWVLSVSLWSFMRCSRRNKRAGQDCPARVWWNEVQAWFQFRRPGKQHEAVQHGVLN